MLLNHVGIPGFDSQHGIVTQDFNTGSQYVGRDRKSAAQGHPCYMGSLKTSWATSDPVSKLKSLRRNHFIVDKEYLNNHITSVTLNIEIMVLIVI